MARIEVAARLAERTATATLDSQSEQLSSLASTEDDLAARYTSLCDPRLNYAQALEMAFRVARRLRP